jgi:large subunit ribosomal protein L4e
MVRLAAPMPPLAPMSDIVSVRCAQASRPQITVFSSDNGAAASTVTLPAVFKAPIRTDLVQFVHSNMAKNRRQAYAVAVEAGHQTPAISWGTGRAVARIPRVPGGGTGRSGQGAFGNMCRGGRMFAPTKVWRRWHRRINLNQRRYATVSAVAASALPALLLARGHQVSALAEVPLVVDNGIESIQKTAVAAKLLKTLGAYADVEKSQASRQVRSGKGKLRNRRHVQRRGPLIVYNDDHGITQAFRNLPGVDLVKVTRLNLLQLAPGGHVGRFIIWSQGAFSALDALYGTWRKASSLKKDYNLPRPLMLNADVARLINSDEVQSVVRAAKAPSKRAQRKKNPLVNLNALLKLNPYAQTAKRNEILFSAARAAAKAKQFAAKK